MIYQLVNLFLFVFILVSCDQSSKIVSDRKDVYKIIKEDSTKKYIDLDLKVKRGFIFENKGKICIKRIDSLNKPIDTTCLDNIELVNFNYDKDGNIKSQLLYSMWGNDTLGYIKYHTNSILDIQSEYLFTYFPYTREKGKFSLSIHSFDILNYNRFIAIYSVHPETFDYSYLFHEEIKKNKHDVTVDIEKYNLDGYKELQLVMIYRDPKNDSLMHKQSIFTPIVRWKE